MGLKRSAMKAINPGALACGFELKAVSLGLFQLETMGCD